MMVQFADRLSAQHPAQPPSWGWLDGALKGREREVGRLQRQLEGHRGNEVSGRGFGGGLELKGHVAILTEPNATIHLRANPTFPPIP